MSALGHSRHFDRATITSGLPRLADIFRVRWHVSKVPKPEVVAARRRVVLIPAFRRGDRLPVTSQGLDPS
jgi:hypothetical protein